MNGFRLFLAASLCLGAAQLAMGPRVELFNTGVTLCRDANSTSTGLCPLSLPVYDISYPQHMVSLGDHDIVTVGLQDFDYRNTVVRGQVRLSTNAGIAWRDMGVVDDRLAVVDGALTLHKFTWSGSLPSWQPVPEGEPVAAAVCLMGGFPISTANGTIDSIRSTLVPWARVTCALSTALDQWYTLPPLPAARAMFGAASHRGALWVLGGLPGPGLIHSLVNLDETTYAPLFMSASVGVQLGNDVCNSSTAALSQACQDAIISGWVTVPPSVLPSALRKPQAFPELFVSMLMPQRLLRPGSIGYAAVKPESFVVMGEPLLVVATGVFCDISVEGVCLFPSMDRKSFAVGPSATSNASDWLQLGSALPVSFSSSTPSVGRVLPPYLFVETQGVAVQGGGVGPSSLGAATPIIGWNTTFSIDILLFAGQAVYSTSDGVTWGLIAVVTPSSYPLTTSDTDWGVYPTPKPLAVATRERGTDRAFVLASTPAGFQSLNPHACLACPSYHWRARGCAFNATDRVCNRCSSCDLGTYRVAACSATANTLCTPCTVCARYNLTTAVGCSSVADARCGGPLPSPGPAPSPGSGSGVVTIGIGFGQSTASPVQTATPSRGSAPGNGTAGGSGDGAANGSGTSASNPGLVATNLAQGLRSAVVAIFSLLAAGSLWSAYRLMQRSPARDVTQAALGRARRQVRGWILTCATCGKHRGPAARFAFHASGKEGSTSAHGAWFAAADTPAASGGGTFVATLRHSLTVKLARAAAAMKSGGAATGDRKERADTSPAAAAAAAAVPRAPPNNEGSNEVQGQALPGQPAATGAGASAANSGAPTFTVSPLALVVGGAGVPGAAFPPAAPSRSARLSRVLPVRVISLAALSVLTSLSFLSVLVLVAVDEASLDTVLATVSPSHASEVGLNAACLSPVDAPELQAFLGSTIHTLAIVLGVNACYNAVGVVLFLYTASRQSTRMALPIFLKRHPCFVRAVGVMAALTSPRLLQLLTAGIVLSGPREHGGGGGGLGPVLKTPVNPFTPARQGVLSAMIALSALGLDALYIILAATAATTRLSSSLAPTACVSETTRGLASFALLLAALSVTCAVFAPVASFARQACIERCESGRPRRCCARRADAPPPAAPAPVAAVATTSPLQQPDSPPSERRLEVQQQRRRSRVHSLLHEDTHSPSARSASRDSSSTSALT